MAREYEGQRTKEFVQARRERVLALMDGTRTYAEVSKALGATSSMIEKDVTALREMGHAPKLKPRRQTKITKKVVEKMRRLSARGLPIYKIANEIGCADATVRKYLKGECVLGEELRQATHTDVVVYADGSRLTVSHGVSAESARRMALAMSRGRKVVSHTVEAA